MNNCQIDELVRASSISNHGWPTKKTSGFQPFKTVRFEFLSVTPRTFLLDKSLKVTQIYFYSQTQIFTLSLKPI